MKKKSKDNDPLQILASTFISDPEPHNSNDQLSINKLEAVPIAKLFHDGNEEKDKK